MNGCKGATPGAYVELFGKKLNQAPHEVDYPYLDTSPKLTCPTNPKIYNSGAQVTQGVKVDIFVCLVFLLCQHLTQAQKTINSNNIKVNLKE